MKNQKMRKDQFSSSSDVTLSLPTAATNGRSCYHFLYYYYSLNHYYLYFVIFFIIIIIYIYILLLFLFELELTYLCRHLEFIIMPNKHAILKVLSTMEIIFTVMFINGTQLIS